jgi:Transposase
MYVHGGPGRVKQLLFVGDDWAEDHHDVEVMDAAGRRLCAAKLPEGIAGMARFHAMIAAQLDPDADLDAQAGQVLIGIETDRGPWVQALIAAGYRVYAVNPLQAARYRGRLQRHCRIRSYLVSARNHGRRPIDAIRDALTANPWVPTQAA